LFTVKARTKSPRKPYQRWHTLDTNWNAYNRQVNSDYTRTPSPLPAARGFRRFGAFIHEGFFLVALIFIAQLLVTRLAGGELKGAWRWISQGFLFVVLGVYFVWQWTGGRRTLALKTWGLRLVRARDGAPLAFTDALTRYLAIWIGPALALGAYTAVGRVGLVFAFVGFAWAFVNRDRQTLHDQLAGTRLVRAD
jgi:uncharacterized RDD family membrane protein YckC